MSLSDEIYLIGDAISELPRFQLPTNRQVLSLYEYKRRLNPQFTLRRIATSVIKEVFFSWSELQVSVREKKHVRENMETVA